MYVAVSPTANVPLADEAEAETKVTELVRAMGAPLIPVKEDVKAKSLSEILPVFLTLIVNSVTSVALTMLFPSVSVRSEKTVTSISGAGPWLYKTEKPENNISITAIRFLREKYFMLPLLFI